MLAMEKTMVLINPTLNLLCIKYFHFKLFKLCMLYRVPKEIFRYDWLTEGMLIEHIVAIERRR